jgi:hypothetical protein
MSKSELTPYSMQIDGEDFWVLGNPKDRETFLAEHPNMHPHELGLIAIGAFRDQSYVDYIVIGRVDDEEESVDWFYVHEMYEQLDWMAGTVYKDQEREKQLKKTERQLGHFALVNGWGPNYVLETKPSEHEMDSYVAHVVAKDIKDGEIVFPPLGEEEEEDS